MVYTQLRWTCSRHYNLPFWQTHDSGPMQHCSWSGQASIRQNSYTSDNNLVFFLLIICTKRKKKVKAWNDNTIYKKKDLTVESEQEKWNSWKKGPLNVQPCSHKGKHAHTHAQGGRRGSWISFGDGGFWVELWNCILTTLLSKITHHTILCKTNTAQTLHIPTPAKENNKRPWTMHTFTLPHLTTPQQTKKWFKSHVYKQQVRRVQSDTLAIEGERLDALLRWARYQR